MNIYQAIGKIWRETEELAKRLPPERVLTERIMGKPIYPYAIITSIASTPRFRTSKADVDSELFQLTIYADNHADAMEIQAIARDVLRNAKPVADDGTVVLFEKSTGSRTTEEGRITMALDQYVAEISKDRRN